MPERKFLLSRFLVAQGVFTTGVGLTWLMAATSGRLAGIAWLEYVLAWVPGDIGLDAKVGATWILCGIIMALGGAFYEKLPKLGAAAYGIGLCLPFAMALIFMGAWITSGFTGHQYANAWSYIGFTTFLWVYMIPNRKKGVIPPLPDALDEGVPDDSR